MTIVEVMYEDMAATSRILDDAREFSLKISMDAQGRKSLIMSAASYFEMRLTETIQKFSDENSNPIVSSIIKNKAIARQYHTWFDWKSSNANQFFGMMGNEFKKYMEQIIKSDQGLQESIEAFMELGRERNLLAHSNYAGYSINKTPKEVYETFIEACKFADNLGSYLSSFMRDFTAPSPASPHTTSPPSQPRG